MSRLITSVVLSRSLSNPTPSPLFRAIRAYNKLDLAEPAPRHTSGRRPKRAKTLNAIELARIKDRYLAGVTTRELGRQFKVNEQTVQRKLRQMGVRMRGSSLTPDEADRAQQLYSTGLSLAEVATRLNLGEGGVRMGLIRAGVPMRDNHGR